jgi:hypothetical protein
MRAYTPTPTPPTHPPTPTCVNTLYEEDGGRKKVVGEKCLSSCHSASLKVSVKVYVKVCVEVGALPAFEELSNSSLAGGGAREGGGAEQAPDGQRSHALCLLPH